MAQHVHTTFIDDIDGSKADRTFEFSIEGDFYEIDLSASNIAEFTDAIAGFIESARMVKLPARRGRPRKEDARVKDGGVAGRAAEIRAWAKDNGYDVNVRGRIPVAVTEAFDAARRQPTRLAAAG